VGRLAIEFGVRPKRTLGLKANLLPRLIGMEASTGAHHWRGDRRQTGLWWACCRRNTCSRTWRRTRTTFAMRRPSARPQWPPARLP